MNKRETHLDEVGYRRALSELGSLKETRRNISRSLGTVEEPERLPQLYADLATINQRVAIIERELSTKYKEVHEAIPIDPSTLVISEDLPYDLSFEERRGYVVATLRASALPLRAARTIFQDIFTRVRPHGVGRVMIETDIRDLGTEEEVFKIMTELVKTLPGYRIALLNRDLGQRSTMAFAAGVGRLNGHDHRYFAEPQEAENWLLGWD